MITWEQYVNRRKVVVDRWLSANNIATYEQLVNVCRGRGVQPPSREDIEQHFSDVVHTHLPRPQPKPQKVVQQPPITKSVSEVAPIVSSQQTIDEPLIEESPTEEPVIEEPEVEKIPVTVSSDEEPTDDNADLDAYEVDKDGFLVVNNTGSFGSFRVRNKS